MESGRHTSPMSVDVSVESGRHTSPMSVDVSMESAENVLLSPSTSMGAPSLIQNDCFSVASGPLSTSGASSLRVGHVKSRNHIPRPYTIRSSARSLAKGDGFMPDRDKEMAMLEEAAKNVPLFNLPANFSFTKNVGHSTISKFFRLTFVPRSSLPSTMPRPPKCPTPNHFHTRHLEYRLPKKCNQQFPVFPISSPALQLFNLLRSRPLL